MCVCIGVEKSWSKKEKKNQTCDKYEHSGVRLKTSRRPVCTVADPWKKSVLGEDEEARGVCFQVVCSREEGLEMKILRRRCA